MVNVSGHRLSTAEIEAALLESSLVGEAAVVGVPDDLVGQAVLAFVAVKNRRQQQQTTTTTAEASSVDVDESETKTALTNQVRRTIGPFAAPKTIYLVPDLPKTRSGKIMRRVLRKIVSGVTAEKEEKEEEEEKDERKDTRKDDIDLGLGDTSTLSDPAIVDQIVDVVRKGKKR